MDITWRIINLEWIEQVGENAKVVKNIHFWIDAVNGSNKGYTWGNIQLDISQLDGFIDFDNLTEEQCINWAKNALDDTYRGGYKELEDEAVKMCLEGDPMRKRGVGLPWQ